MPDPTPTPEPEFTSRRPGSHRPERRACRRRRSDPDLEPPLSEDADSVTGYEVLRAVGEGEMASLVADTASTTTSYNDATAIEAGETYAYQVKAIGGKIEARRPARPRSKSPMTPVTWPPPA